MIDSDADFAFFLESPAAEYEVRKNSGLTTVGGLLNTNGHGIALPQGKRQKMRQAGTELCQAQTQAQMSLHVEAD